MHCTDVKGLYASVYYLYCSRPGIGWKMSLVCTVIKVLSNRLRWLSSYSNGKNSTLNIYTVEIAYTRLVRAT